ncbi:unnamed protein product [Pleuronectes platessa]|uniref:Uncharacterized protein n=1 Tax=Pleuronectes platessa TaxID=8262 RepID=A0A9N7V3D5_PLEPL|nr:unnamed protein product [Pleuronectes platessa]
MFESFYGEVKDKALLLRAVRAAAGGTRHLREKDERNNKHQGNNVRETDGAEEGQEETKQRGIEENHQLVKDCQAVRSLSPRAVEKEESPPHPEVRRTAQHTGLTTPRSKVDVQPTSRGSPSQAALRALIFEELESRSDEEMRARHQFPVGLPSNLSGIETVRDRLMETGRDAVMSRDQEGHHGDRPGERERSGRDLVFPVFPGGLKTSRPEIDAYGLLLLSVPPEFYYSCLPLRKYKCLLLTFLSLLAGFNLTSDSREHRDVTGNTGD